MKSNIKRYICAARFIVAMILSAIILVTILLYYYNLLPLNLTIHRVVFCVISSLCGFVSLILNLNNIYQMNETTPIVKNKKIQFITTFIVVYIPLILAISSLVYAILQTQIPTSKIFYFYAFPICFISTYLIDVILEKFIDFAFDKLKKKE